MHLKQLADITQLPMALGQTDIDQRVRAVIAYAQRHPEEPCAHIAEALVEVLGFQSYAGSLQAAEEVMVLKWIDESFSPDNMPYLDAVATLYAHMSSQEARRDLISRRAGLTDPSAQQAFDEAISEFAPRLGP